VRCALGDFGCEHEEADALSPGPKRYPPKKQKVQKKVSRSLKTQRRKLACQQLVKHVSS